MQTNLRKKDVKDSLIGDLNLKQMDEIVSIAEQFFYERCDNQEEKIK